MSTPSFRGRTPRPLAFGTSGLRGLVEDITDLEAWIATRGFLEFLVQRGDCARGPVAVAGDLRPSTPRIARAVHRAAVDAGFEVVDCGTIPSPALAYFAFSQRMPSVMVTGSHIPFDRNGIKFNLPGGEVLKSDEARILAAIEAIRSAAYAEPAATSPFDDEGMFLADAPSPAVAVDARAQQVFLTRYLSVFGQQALKGMRVAVYQHSAVGRDLLAKTLEELGATVVAVGRSETFVPVDTEAVDDAALERIRTLAEPSRVALGGLDAVVSTDGDSDRPLLVAVDEAGTYRFVRGDTLGAMVAEDLQADALAVPVSASDQVDLHLVRFGMNIHRTRIGSPWVVAQMEAMDGHRKVGFEANGGFLVGSALAMDRGVLAPLPTRDAFLPVVVVLARAAATGQALSERLASLPARFTTAGLLDEVPPPRAREALAKISVPGLDEGDFRKEGAAELRKVKALIESMFSPLEVGRLVHVNWIDGVRMTFDGGDVVHLRASGNAPQFRLYATADSMERAGELVATGLALGGPVRKMLSL